MSTTPPGVRGVSLRAALALGATVAAALTGCTTGSDPGAGPDQARTAGASYARKLIDNRPTAKGAPDLDRLTLDCADEADQREDLGEPENRRAWIEGCEGQAVAAQEEVGFRVMDALVKTEQELNPHLVGKIADTDCPRLAKPEYHHVDVRTGDRQRKAWIDGCLSRVADLQRELADNSG